MNIGQAFCVPRYSIQDLIAKAHTSEPRIESAVTMIPKTDGDNLKTLKPRKLITKTPKAVKIPSTVV